MTEHQPSATVFFTDVLTAHAFRVFFTFTLATGMLFGAISKLGIARRHFKAWLDLDLIAWMPAIGTVELLLVVALVIPRSRLVALCLAVVYHLGWMVVSYGIDDWDHVFRSLALVGIGVLGLTYGRPWRDAETPS